MLLRNGIEFYCELGPPFFGFLPKTQLCDYEPIWLVENEAWVQEPQIFEEVRVHQRV
jgi:hypothetical protein